MIIDVRDGLGRWRPLALNDEEIQAELKTATGLRRRALLDEWEHRLMTGSLARTTVSVAEEEG